MNEIGLVLEKLYRSKEEKFKDMCAINNWMHKKNVDSYLQFQVREYLQYFWAEISQEDIERKQRVLK